MKTIKQWLKEGLSEEDYKRAEKYERKSWDLEVESFKGAISEAFTWMDTQEGYDYWDRIYVDGGSKNTDTHEWSFTKCGKAILVSPNTDPIVQAVCEDLMNRSKLGIKKYGTTLKGAGLSDKELLQHAYEEVLDLANYLKTLITKHNG